MSERQYIKQFLFLVTLLILTNRIAFSQSVYVPLNHWSYEFIDRMETKGLITDVLNSTKPYSREEMVGYLVQLKKNIDNGAALNTVEQDQLKYLQFEFSDEFNEQNTGTDIETSYPTTIQKVKNSKPFSALPNFIYQNNRNLYTVRSHDFKAYLDPILYKEWLYANPDSLSSNERVFERTHGFTLWGRLGTHMGFFFNFRDTKEWGTRSYPKRFEISLEGLGFVNGFGTHIWHDETNAYLMFKLPYMQLMLGKDFNYWGPGTHGALGLSNNATSFDQIKLQAKFWNLKFTYLWGFLQTFPKIFEETGETVPKNIVAHRLDWALAKWLNIGLYEAIIFGKRRFELAYINPINFYRSAEHFLTDDDNASMGADFELMLIPNIKLYGEFFLDDFNTSKGSNFHGNKKAYLVGAYWADAFKIVNLDARIEYARSRPFVYSHRQSINSYTNFSTGLGHWMGPNADDLYTRLQYRFSRKLFTAATFEIYRHGDNEPGRNVGGDITQPSGEEFVDFLDGTREKRTSFGFEINYEVLRNLIISTNFKSTDSKQMLLPTGTRGPVARNEFFVNIGLNR